MKLTFIGSGSAFTVNSNNYHSNMLFETDSGKKLLIDCGSDARVALAALDYSHKDISGVYISHLHADHAGGLEWLAFTTVFDTEREEKPTLYISRSIIQPLWEHVLSGGMASLQGRIATLETYFKPHPLNKNEPFYFDGVRFDLLQTVHIMNGFCIVPSFGLIFKVGDKTIFITTDTQFCPDQTRDFYAMADLIFHDCETTKTMSGVHSHYSQLKTLSDEVKAKMWLYHYNPGPLPNCVNDGFRGFVERGQVFDFDDDSTLEKTARPTTTKKK